MAEVEQRWKDEEEAKNRPAKANQPSNATVDPALLQEGQTGGELAGNSRGITNVPGMEDMMGVFNYLIS